MSYYQEQHRKVETNAGGHCDFQTMYLSRCPFKSHWDVVRRQGFNHIVEASARSCEFYEANKL